MTLSSVPVSRSTTSALPRSEARGGAPHRSPRPACQSGRDCRTWSTNSEAIGRWAAKHRHFARPRHGMRGDQRPVRGLVFGQMRQVHQQPHRARRTPTARVSEAARGFAGRQIVGRAVLAHRPRCRAPRHRRWRRAEDRPAARHARAGSRRPDPARAATAADGMPPSRAPPTPPSTRGGSGARLLGRHRHREAFRGDAGRGPR